MPEPADLFRAWETVIREIGNLASSVVSGSAEIGGQIASPLQSQVEQLQQIVMRQIELERQLLSVIATPAKRILDLSSQTTDAMAAQARAFREMSLSMAQAADLLEQQAELLGSAIGTVRDPVSALRAAGDALRDPSAKRTGTA